VKPVELGAVMCGEVIAEVVESKHPKFAVGDFVHGDLGWQLYAVSDGKGMHKLDPRVPLTAQLSVVGMAGLTAYFGLLDIGQPKPGETVVVSAAAGAVGGIVGQLAKIQGARAVGIAGGVDKCRFVVEELGFDACLDYKAGDLAGQLKAAPKGVDVYFDNVGGEILDTVLGRMNTVLAPADVRPDLAVQRHRSLWREEYPLDPRQPDSRAGLHRVRLRRSLQAGAGRACAVARRGPDQVS
jgi:NADPH-dependent curcumin reductase CurA